MKLPYILLRQKAQNNTVLREAFGEACGDKEQNKGKTESRWFSQGHDQKADGSLFPNWGVVQLDQNIWSVYNGWKISHFLAKAVNS